MRLHPSVMLPTQLHGKSATSGCINLQAALIESGINGVESKNEKVRQAALEWIASERHDIGSFRFACDIIGIDPEILRRWAINTRPPKVKPRRILRYVY